MTCSDYRRLEFGHIAPLVPLSHSTLRVDDRRVISSIIFVLRVELRWRDVPLGYGSHQTIYNRFIQWSPKGCFDRIQAALAGQLTGALYGKASIPKAWLKKLALA